MDYFNQIKIESLTPRDTFLVDYYSIKIDKTGVNKKTGGEGIYAPLAFTIMSAILCYGLANKIYV